MSDPIIIDASLATITAVARVVQIVALAAVAYGVYRVVRRHLTPSCPVYRSAQPQYFVEQQQDMPYDQEVDQAMFNLGGDRDEHRTGAAA